MKQSGLTFDPSKDVRPVDEFGFVDIHDALVNNAIPADLQAQVAKFNNIEDPVQVAGHVDDVFAGMRAERQYAEIVHRESTANGGQNS